MTRHFCRKKFKGIDKDANENSCVRLCKLKTFAVLGQTRPPLTLVGVTVECNYDSHVLGGLIIPPLLHCLSSSLSLTLKTSLFPSLFVSCPHSSPSHAPCWPLTPVPLSPHWLALHQLHSWSGCPFRPVSRPWWIACRGNLDRIESILVFHTSSPPLVLSQSDSLSSHLSKSRVPNA